MGRSVLLVLILATTQSAFGAFDGYIEVVAMNTYDSGSRTLNGRWYVGSYTQMRYHNYFGTEVSTSWQTYHHINSSSGADIASNNRSFSNSRWVSDIIGVGDFATCYRGRATAITADDTRGVGGGEICTGGPLSLPPDDCGTRPASCDDWDPTCPLILNLTPGAWQLSGADDPVRFDLDADGVRETLTWTAAGSALAFLALDRNGNGRIDDGRELFGNAGGSANGFDALGLLDANGDGVVDAADEVWPLLLLWTDRNHDGQSEPAELRTVSSSAVRTLELRHHWTGRTDRYGNAFRYEGLVRFGNSSRPYYDVFFTRP